MARGRAPRASQGPLAPRALEVDVHPGGEVWVAAEYSDKNYYDALYTTRPLAEPLRGKPVQ